jgi:hypothetical protein
MRTTALALALAVLATFACKPSRREPPTGACPADAMLCPDGSAVGRTGPNCTFPPCPEAKGDPCDGVELPACPPECPQDGMSRCGQACEQEGD